jgi:hypothetical protein
VSRVLVTNALDHLYGSGEIGHDMVRMLRRDHTEVRVGNGDASSYAHNTITLGRSVLNGNADRAEQVLTREVMASQPPVPGT